MRAIATSDNAFVLRPRWLPTRLLRLARDERLVEQVRDGSAAAFDVVYDRHHRGVLAFCRHMLGSVEEAEDAVQHTFMVAYRALVHSGQRIELRPWLYAVARNRCLTVLRTRHEQPVGELAEPATENLAVEVQRREDLRELLRDLAGLPEEQRAALVLAELGDVSHDDIARVLGCERAKVKALVFQARSSLHTSRTARETSCVQIREQLANLHGGSLRRNTLRRHLRECAGCREYRRRVRAQRRALAIVLPVAPSVGLKEAVLGSALGGAGAAGTAGLAGSAGTFAAKALVVATVAGGGATAGVETVSSSPEPAPPAIAVEPQESRPSAPRANVSVPPIHVGARAAPAARPRWVSSGRTHDAGSGELARGHGKGRSDLGPKSDAHGGAPVQATPPKVVVPPGGTGGSPPASAQPQHPPKADHTPAPAPTPEPTPPPAAAEPAPTATPPPPPAEEPATERPADPPATDPPEGSTNEPADPPAGTGETGTGETGGEGTGGE
jgi:RNA polymerase sigma factor (sigma-70 family)